MSAPAQYGSVTPEVVRLLAGIAGEANVLTGETRTDYAHDEAPNFPPVLPDVVVKPPDTASVAAVLRMADERRIPVTPRGAGTGLSGGAVPTLGGIVLSLERMNRVIEIDAANFVATVEPGVVLGDLHKAVEAQGLYYPLYPGELTASIGGNVATNAGGMRAVRYGVTRNFVLGLEAVLPGGEVIETGGKYFKCSTGYDLTQLIAGSEGTLAVITRILLRLIAPPGRRDIVLVPFDSLQRAIDVVPKVLREGILPVGIEFIDKDVAGLVDRYRGKEIPLRGFEAFLMIILEAESDEAMQAQAARLGDICLEHGAIDVLVATGDRARDMMDFREKAWPAIAHAGNAELIDVVVPRSRIADLVRQVMDASRQRGITMYTVGHAGDGNIHFAPLVPDAPDAKQRVKGLFREVYRLGVAMGGTISGEHGIGGAKREYLDIAVPAAKLALMRRLKAAFDPRGIMNPGKVF